MPRSLKKGPFVKHSLEKKVLNNVESRNSVKFFLLREILVGN